MICSNCQHENKSLATFCASCGVNLVVAKAGNYNVPVRNILIFFFTMLSYIVILQFTDFGDNYIKLLIADSIYAIIVLVFFTMEYRKNKRLLKFGKFNFTIFGIILSYALVGAFVVYHLATFLNHNVFDRAGTVYYEQFRDSPYPFFLCIVSIALFPAIFEEIAFRGILFDQSLKLIGLKPTIIFSAILFTVLHLSVISALWLLPFGICFGYLRARYNTLVYGMIGHFLYNTGIVLMELLYQ